MRSRPQTIGSLGRAPARASIPPPNVPPPRLPGADVQRRPVRDWLRGALLDNLGLKFVSLVLALTVYLLVKDDRDREITVPVGVLYVLPEDRVLTSDRIDEVRVTIRGPWRRMRDFDERAIPRITLDLRAVATGELAFAPDMVEVPAGLTVADITPKTMRVSFDPRSEKVVEVVVQQSGRPEHGYVVREIKTSPSTVRVRGAEPRLAELTAVRTQEVNLDTRITDFSVVAKIVPPQGLELVGSSDVEIAVRIDEELVTRKFPELAVRVRGEGVDPARWSITPPNVEVTLTGALLMVEKARDLMSPVVRVTAADRSSRDARDVAVVIDGLPPGVGVRVSPERVKLAPTR